MSPDALKDELWWERLGSLLRETDVSDQELAIIRARLVARLNESSTILQHGATGTP